MKVRTLVILVASLCVAADASEKDVNKDLEKAVKKTTAVKSYTFTITTQPGQGARNGVEGKYQKGQPVFFRADRIAFYKKGAALAYEQGGQWHKSKTGIQSDPLLILAAVAKVRKARLPHEELATLAKSLKGVKKAKGESGSTVYTGGLTDAGVKKLAPSEFVNVAKSGTAKLWVNAKGLVVKYTIAVELEGRQGNAEVKGSAGKTVTLGELGSAKVEVPAGAKKALK